MAKKSEVDQVGMNHPGTAENFRRVPLKDLVPSPFNEKRSEQYDDEALNELADSVKSVGVLQPLLARPAGNKLEIVFGERRFIAAKRAGLNDVPVFVAELTDGQARALQIVENMQREQAPLSIEAGSVADLLASGMSQAEIATYLGKPNAWVCLRRSISDLIPMIRALVDKHGRPAQWELVSRLTPEQQENLFDRELDDEWSLHQFVQQSVNELRERLMHEYTMALKEAPWKLDDATINLTAGPCSLCLKRSSQQVVLFPELADSEEDTCLDSDCFKAKLDAFRAIRLADLKAKHPKAKLVATDHRDAVEDIPHVYKGDLTYKKATKSTPGAVQVLDISTGKVTYQAADSMDDDGPSKLVKPTTLAERREFLELRRWKHVADALIEGGGEMRVAKMNRTIEEVFGYLLAMRVTCSSSTFDAYCVNEVPNPADLSNVHTEAVLEGHGWTKNITFQTAKDVQVEDVKFYADFFGIDLAPLKLKADQSIPEPKSWAKLQD